MFDLSPQQGGNALSIPDAATRVDVAISFLEREGWVQRKWKTSGGMRCIGQALLEAYGIHVEKHRDRKLGALPITPIINAAVRKHTGRQDLGIVEFNDNGDTRLETVLEVLATARRWIIDGTCGSDISGKKSRKRVNRRLAELQTGSQAVLAAA